MREQPANNLCSHSGDGDDKTDQQQRFVVCAILVLMAAPVVVSVPMIVVSTILMGVVQMSVVRQRLYVQRRVAGFTMHAGRLVVDMSGGEAHGHIIVSIGNRSDRQ